MDTRDEITDASRHTTPNGMNDLVRHIEKLLETDQLDPRFVDKLVRKIRAELNEEAASPLDALTHVQSRGAVEELSLRVIHKKADVLSGLMARLRDAD